MAFVSIGEPNSKGPVAFFYDLNVPVFSCDRRRLTAATPCWAASCATETTSLVPCRIRPVRCTGRLNLGGINGARDEVVSTFCRSDVPDKTTKSG